MAKITIECCEGIEQYSNYYLRDRCPVYRAAKEKRNRSWPYLPTGFGNAWGYRPTHII